MLARTEHTKDELLVPNAAKRMSARELEFARARAHSKVIRLLKWIFPIAGVLTTAAFSVYTILSRVPELTYDISASAYADGKLVMASPKLDGVTSDNRPYSMTAARAIQDMKQEGIIELVEIAAKLPIDVTNSASIVAARGVYDSQKNTLDVTTPVTVETTSGMVAKLQSAFLEMDKGLLTTPKPVVITVKGAKVTSDTMSILENGKVLVFEKRVRMDIDPKQMRATEQAGDQNAGN